MLIPVEATGSRHTKGSMNKFMLRFFYSAVVGCVKRAFARSVCAKVRSAIILATRQSETARVTHHLGPCCKSEPMRAYNSNGLMRNGVLRGQIMGEEVIDVDK